MGFEKWKTLIKKARDMDDKWDTLIEAPSSKEPLGPIILTHYLQKDGDIIEIDMKDKDRRAIGNFLKSLRLARTNEKTDFLLRYSEDFKKAYVKRLG